MYLIRLLIDIEPLVKHAMAEIKAADRTMPVRPTVDFLVQPCTRARVETINIELECINPAINALFDVKGNKKWEMAFDKPRGGVSTNAVDWL